MPCASETVRVGEGLSLAGTYCDEWPKRKEGRMPLRIIHRSQDEVPTPSRMGRINLDLEALKAEMRKLAPTMVLEIETEGERTARSVKTLISRAGTDLGNKWQHWSVGTKIYARPKEERRRTRRQREDRANLGDFRK